MTDRRRVAILGSTGSIGRQALDVLRDHRETHAVVALAAHRNLDLLSEQVAEFAPDAACLTGGPGELPCRSLTGPDGLLSLLEDTRPDVVLHAITGAAGLPASFRTLELGVDLALASKESLVMAGGLLLDLAAAREANLLPVDSEHSAIFQCLRAGRGTEVRRLYLTASGGPFRGRTRDELREIAPAEALRHPTWQMGPKITIDSATLMNKGLEVIEAHHLFDVPVDEIRVIVHPESVVHSLVEFYDGSIIAHLGATDMRIPIQYALSHPARWERPEGSFSLLDLDSLNFERPDPEVFPSVEMAREACRRGGTSPVVLNAANERAVELFLSERIPFLGIFEIVARALDDDRGEPVTDLEQILAVDRRTREEIDGWI